MIRPGGTALVAAILVAAGSPAWAQDGGDSAVLVTLQGLAVELAEAAVGPGDLLRADVLPPRAGVVRGAIHVVARLDEGGKEVFAERRTYDERTRGERFPFFVPIPEDLPGGTLIVEVRVEGLRSSKTGVAPFTESATVRAPFGRAAGGGD